MTKSDEEAERGSRADVKANNVCTNSCLCVFTCVCM